MKPSWASVLTTIRVNDARVQSTISFRHRLQNETAIIINDGVCCGRVNVDKWGVMIPATWQCIVWITADNTWQTHSTTFHCWHVANWTHYSCTLYNQQFQLHVHSVKQRSTLTNNRVRTEIWLWFSMIFYSTKLLYFPNFSRYFIPLYINKIH